METNTKEKLPLNVSIENISHLPLVKQMQSVCPVAGNGFIKVHPYGHTFPTGMENYLKKISEFECRDDDIWVSSFPKCGTTWTQEMVWCIINNVDITTAKAVPLKDRAPFFEHTGLSAGRFQYEADSFGKVDEMTSPRIIKTHLPFDMLPRECHDKKLIYVARNPRDVCVSFYYHHQIFLAYGGSFKEFARLFMNGICEYSPMLPHVLTYWKHRKQHNILFLTYEEMKRNLSSVITKVATSVDVEILCSHLSFNNMRENNSVNRNRVVDAVLQDFKMQKVDNLPKEASLIRKGEVGNWKEHFDDEQLNEFLDWERDGLNGEDLKFVYELEEV